MGRWAYNVEGESVHGKRGRGTRVLYGSSRALGVIGPGDRPSSGDLQARRRGIEAEGTRLSLRVDILDISATSRTRSVGDGEKRIQEMGHTKCPVRD